MGNVRSPFQQDGRAVGADEDIAGVHRALSHVLNRVMAESEKSEGICCRTGRIHSNAHGSEGDGEQQEEGRKFVCVL